MDLTTPADFLEKLNDNRLYRALGIRIVEAGEGSAVAELRAAADVCWPVPGQPHGGIVFTLMDTTMATAVMTGLGAEQRCATIGVDIQFTSPAQGDYLTAHALCTHRTGRMCFLRGEIRSDRGVLIALGQGSFRVFAQNHGINVV